MYRRTGADRLWKAPVSESVRRDRQEEEPPTANPSSRPDDGETTFM